MNRCSDAELLTWLQKALTRENGSWLFYMTCAHIANGPAGDSLREMFLEHAEEEQQHALLIGRKIVALGGYPEPCIDTFNAPETNEAALMLLYFREQEAAELYRCISEACGDDVALRNEIDQIASKEVEHAEELLRLMSPEAAASIRAASSTASGQSVLASARRPRRIVADYREQYAVNANSLCAAFAAYEAVDVKFCDEIARRCHAVGPDGSGGARILQDVALRTYASIGHIEGPRGAASFVDTGDPTADTLLWDQSGVFLVISPRKWRTLSAAKKNKASSTKRR